MGNVEAVLDGDLDRIIRATLLQQLGRKSGACEMSEYERDARRARLDALRESGYRPLSGPDGWRGIAIGEVRALWGDVGATLVRPGARRREARPQVAVDRAGHGPSLLWKADLHTACSRTERSIQVSAQQAVRSIPSCFRIRIGDLDVGDFIRGRGPPVAHQAPTSSPSMPERSQMLSKSLRPAARKVARA